MTDPIADMLTRIRNAQRVGNKTVDIPFSKVKRRILDILHAEGYVGTLVEEIQTRPAYIRVQLKYEGRQPTIRSLVRESKPGHRMYRQAGELPRVLNDYGIAVVSTSEGLMTNKEARERGIGGEVVCSVY